MRDLSDARAAYETGGESLRQVEERLGVSERTLFRRSAKEGWKSGSTNGTTSDFAATNDTAGMAPLPESGSTNGSTPDPAATNGTAEMAPLPESGSTNGSTPTPAATNGTAEMAPLPESGSTNGTTPAPAATIGTAVIPADINTLNRLAAVQFYFNTLNWAIHPLLAPDRGEPRDRGKKPILKGWRKHIAADITPEDLAKNFGPGTNHNIGCIVRPPFIHVDLDSKPDAGASVMAWLATQPELAAVPRERTGGGAHLAFICRDIPEVVMKVKQAPTCQINDKVNAELYLDGMNLVLSPSVHKNGHSYIEPVPDAPIADWTKICGTKKVGMGGKKDSHARNSVSMISLSHNNPTPNRGKHNLPTRPSSSTSLRLRSFGLPRAACRV